MDTPKGNNAAWAIAKVNEVFFVAGVMSIPIDEREAFLTKLKLTCWEVEHEREEAAKRKGQK